MSKKELIFKIKTEFGDKILNWYDKSPRRIYIDIKPEDIVKVAEYFHRNIKTRFNIASGVHTPKGFEILYHFSSDKFGIVISIRVLLNKDNPEIESIAPILPAAEWIEREMWELLGINFKGHPGLKRLLLPDDWPDGKYPLRRDYMEEK